MLKEAITLTASGTKHNALTVAEEQVDSATKSYSMFISGNLATLMISDYVAKEKKKEIREWLSSRKLEIRHEKFHKDRIAGSGKWFLETGEFKNWMANTLQVLIGSGDGITQSITRN